MVGAKLRELAYMSQQRAGEPICCTAFDPLFDLVWTASSTVRYFWSFHTCFEYHICCIAEVPHDSATLELALISLSDIVLEQSFFSL